jgi:gamma-glutamylcyclotransferase (GGCT)/AIG2-like uncharacterized protein YtfP
MKFDKFINEGIEDYQVVFVYGTLKVGEHLHFYMEDIDAQFIGKGVTVNRYSLYVGLLPKVIENIATSKIYGELYYVDKEGLQELDFLEGIAVGHYYRKKVKVRGPNDIIPAWMYFYNIRNIKYHKDILGELEKSGKYMNLTWENE